MNLPLSLDNLEKTLNQLTKFLPAEKEIEEIPTREFDLQKELAQLRLSFAENKKKIIMPSDARILQFGYHSQALQLIFEYLNTQLENLRALPLENAEFDNSGNPKNKIAQDFMSIFDIISTKYDDNLNASVADLISIGNSFSKNLFTPEQKKNFIAILDKQSYYAKIAKSLLQKSQKILQQSKNLPFQITTFTQKAINFFHCVLINTDIIALLKELIENNDQAVRNNIKKVKDLQQKIEKIYNESIRFSEKTITSSKQELDTEIKNFVNIDINPLIDLPCLIDNIEIYVHFIKDINLKKELSDTLASVANLANKKFSENLSIKTGNVAFITLIPITVREKIINLVGYFENLENRIKKIQKIK